MGERERGATVDPLQIFAVNLQDHPRGRCFNNGYYLLNLQENVQNVVLSTPFIFTKALRTNIPLLFVEEGDEPESKLPM